jgi:hypothetical protein
MALFVPAETSRRDFRSLPASGSAALAAGSCGDIPVQLSCIKNIEFVRRSSCDSW